MEIQICSNCLVDSDFEEFGTAVAGDQPIACDVCGNEFWSLTLAQRGVDLSKAGEKCSYDPSALTDVALGMFHCPQCGEMIVAGMPHPDYSLIK